MITATHIILLVLFVSATSIILASTLISRVRLQPARMTWHTRGIISEAIWPVFFLSLFVGAIIYSGLINDLFYLILGIGYLLGGVFWCITMRLSAATVVTDFAIVRASRSQENVLCWNQVSDFFVHHKNNSAHYIFLYTNSNGSHSRFEVQVPQAYERQFKHLVHRFVERKQSFTPEKAYG